MAVLPTFELIAENEVHFLGECGKYDALRMEQSPVKSKNFMSRKEESLDPTY
jgi:hypothetical protein